MPTSLTSMLSEPVGADKIALGTVGYFRTRNKRRAYDVVLKEFKKSRLSQADLARRLGKRPDVVCRLLGGPGNWTLDTVSDLLFAISGAELDFSVSYPLRKAKRNLRTPAWLRLVHSDIPAKKGISTPTASNQGSVVRSVVQG